MGKHRRGAFRSICLSSKAHSYRLIGGWERKTKDRSIPSFGINGQTVDKMVPCRVGPTEPSRDISGQLSAEANLPTAVGQGFAAHFLPPGSPSVRGGTELFTCASVGVGQGGTIKDARSFEKVISKLIFQRNGKYH